MSSNFAPLMASPIFSDGITILSGAQPCRVRGQCVREAFEWTLEHNRIRQIRSPMCHRHRHGPAEAHSKQHDLADIVRSGGPQLIQNLLDVVPLEIAAGRVAPPLSPWPRSIAKMLNPRLCQRRPARSRTLASA